MSVQATATSVSVSTVVEAPIETAFRVFTEEMDTWWDPNHHLLRGELARMVVEPHPGGRIYDLGTDGTECCWAHVLAIEPPRRFVFSWDISTRWEVESDPEKRSEVEVRFIAQSPERTLVELEHRKLDRHGENWESMRDAVGSGWSLEAFARAAAAAARAT